MPLASSFVLSKKKGNEAWVEPIATDNQLSYTVHRGACPKDKETNKQSRSAIFKCPICGEITTDEYVKEKGKAHQIGEQLMAIVAEGQRGRIYISPNAEHEATAKCKKPEDYPTGAMPQNPRWFSPPEFGMGDYSDLFTNRQLTALTTFSALVAEAQQKAEQDALLAGLPADETPLRDGGTGAKTYCEAVGVYFAFLLGKLADYHSTICSWHNSGEKIGHTFGRMESIWKPVAANEGFEVVRRRLFLPCKDENAKEDVCRAFSQFYLEHKNDFPLEASELTYRERMMSCYPIHPEMFDRLYNDWSTLERFQRTRGVLRLMAAVIHELWMGNDASPMIMPGSLPLDVPNVAYELTRHLNSENWTSIIDSEVDGRHSIPYQMEQSNIRYGSNLAARRIARTVFLGSAPTSREQHMKARHCRAFT